MSAIEQTEQPTVAKKPHLSPSQLESYCRCGEAYRRRYLEGEIIPPGIAMLQGTGLHRGAEHNFRQKIETHEDLPATEIVDAAVSGFEDAVRAGYCLSNEEAMVGPKLVISDAKDQLATLAKLHAEQVAPEYQPVLVEESVRLVLPNSTHDMLGIIDLADDKRRVVDHKVANKRKSQSDADDSVALTFYSAGHRKLTGQPASELRLEVLVKNKTPVRQVITTTREQGDFEALANRINAVLHGIQSGTFAPATPGAWWCSSSFCGYHATCPYVNNKNRGQ